MTSSLGRQHSSEAWQDCMADCAIFPTNFGNASGRTALHQTRAMIVKLKPSERCEQHQNRFSRRIPISSSSAVAAKQRQIVGSRLAPQCLDFDASHCEVAVLLTTASLLACVFRRDVLSRPLVQWRVGIVSAALHQRRLHFGRAFEGFFVLSASPSDGFARRTMILLHTKSYLGACHPRAKDRHMLRAR